MIFLILKCYFTTLLSIALVALFLLLIGFYLIFKTRSTHTSASTMGHPVEPSVTMINISNTIADKKSEIIRKPKPLTITSQDIKAIAGDDVIATQLDLARAYIESGRKTLAKKILQHVAKFGEMTEQQEAHNLLAFLKQEARE